jgi:hypothetical protein
VVRLAACLQLQLAWLQPLLTPACWEGLTLLLLDKLLARLEVLLGRKVRGVLGACYSCSCSSSSSPSLAICSPCVACACCLLQIASILCL